MDDELLYLDDVPDEGRILLKNIPADGFRIKAGQFCTTLLISGVKPVSVVIAASDLETLLSAIGEVLGPTITPDNRDDYYRVWNGMISVFRTGTIDEREGCVKAATWLVFNHPEGAEETRRKVSDLLRESGCAHLSICVNASGMGAAVHDRFVDCSDIVTEAVAVGLNRTFVFTTTEQKSKFH